MSVDQTTPGIQRIDGANWHTKEELIITWDTEAWSDIDLYCDIYLVIYKEGPDYVVIEHVEDGLRIAERVSYDLGEFRFRRFTELSSQIRTGILKLVPRAVGGDSG